MNSNAIWPRGDGGGGWWGSTSSVGESWSVQGEHVAHRASWGAKDPRTRKKSNVISHYSL